MKIFVAKSAIVLLFGCLCSTVAAANSQWNCQFAFGNGVTEQVVVPPGEPPLANIGPIRLRIGPVMIDGLVDMIVTEGFDVFSLNPSNGEGRLTGFGKTTFDFGKLGAFHAWEVDTVTFQGPPPWASSDIIGSIRSGAARDAVADPRQPPQPWGTGFFANADATLTGKGWMRYNVVNSEGVLVNEFTYYLWGRICDVDIRGIAQAQRN